MGHFLLLSLERADSQMALNGLFFFFPLERAQEAKYFGNLIYRLITPVYENIGLLYDGNRSSN